MGVVLALDPGAQNTFNSHFPQFSNSELLVGMSTLFIYILGIFWQASGMKVLEFDKFSTVWEA